MYVPVILASGTVPLVRFDAFKFATEKVPKATASTMSPLVKALAKTIELPDVTVTSVPLTILIPFR